MQPFPVDVTIEEEDEDEDKHKHAGLVTVASSNLPSKKEGVVLRRKPLGSNNNSHDSTDSCSSASADRRARMRRLRHRASAGRSGSPTEAGKLLKLALARHFDKNKQKDDAMGDELDDYVCEVFRQLDYRRRGAVSREDFETLLEVLGLPTAPPSPPPVSNRSNRNSGLEWLSSYRPRPDSPVASPLRVDRLGEVKYRHPSGKKSPASSAQSSTNFLFTLGERPFWELWPQRKWRKRRKLTLDEFKRSLLEQWAKSEGMPMSSLGTVLPVVDRKRRLRGGGQHNYHKSEDVIESVVTDGHTVVNGRPVVRVLRVRSESRTRRVLRSLRRRYHFLDRISRRRSRGRGVKKTPSQQAMSNGVNGHLNGHAPPCPVHVGGTGAQCSDHCNNNIKSKNKRLSRLDNLREQVAHQQEEISTLREVVQDLRSSLQLSDAQNLALQVLLRKVARAEGQLPGASGTGAATTTAASSTHNGHLSSAASTMMLPGSIVRHSGSSAFRSRMDESERQLENLVRELKEMSQVRYPTLQTGTNNMGTTSSSASTTNVFFPSTTLLNGSGNNNNRSNDLDEVDAAVEEHEAIGERLEATAEALGGAGSELAAAEEELAVTADRLREKHMRRNKDDNSGEITEAYAALERAMQELNRLR